MKYLLISLLLISTAIWAEEPETRIIQKSVICGDAKEIIDHMMKTYKEFPRLLAEAKDSNYILLENKNSHSWTLVQFNNEVGCIIGLGEGRIVISSPDSI